MEQDKYLPLGSIVILEGGVKKVMIIARGAAIQVNGQMQYFEYGGCLYPEGVTGEKLLYFNRDNIKKEVAKGYTDEDDALMMENIKEWITKNGYQKGNPYELNKSREGE